MEQLIQILLHLVTKVPYLSESDLEEELDRLREVEKAVNVSGVVPAKAVDANQPAPPPPVVDPGPVAEPVPEAEQPPPPTSPEVAPAPEAANVFTEPGATA